jgi:uncharacterized OsmC-like protein
MVRLITFPLLGAGTLNHDDGASQWSRPRRWSIVVVVPGYRGARARNLRLVIWLDLLKNRGTGRCRLIKEAVVTLSTVIADTRKAVDTDPAVARALFSAEGTLTGVTEVEVRTPTHSFTVDEPPALGGGGTAPNPVEYALASLGSCQAITYRFWAEHLGVAFDKLTVTVEGDLDIRRFLGFDESVRPGFSAVRVRVGITGPESPERYQQLAAAVDEHCPVLDLFSNPVPVDRTITVH